VITDADDLVIEDTDYSIDYRIGVISAATGISFATYPYTVVATVGLSAHPDYADFIEPVINAAILDIVADRWNRRNPAASNESEGGGVGTSYRGVGIPERVQEMLEPFRMVRAL
jgi:pyridoxal/pyridoxine/pyridoxamine kinase